MLITLRDALSEIGSHLPIHVFGTITPGAVLAYFLCGADVFDGLNWLRFAYSSHGLRSIAETALDAGAWDQTDASRLLQQSRENLHFLLRLQEAMRSCCKTGDFEALTTGSWLLSKQARLPQRQVRTSRA